MDLTFSTEEQAFAAEARDWLDAHLRPVPAFESVEDEVAWGRAWQAELAAGRWVGIHWPHEYGGRGASPCTWPSSTREYTRAGAPAAGEPRRHQPGRARRCWPTAPTTRSGAGSARSSRPRRSGASSSASPMPGATWPACARRPPRSTGGWVLNGQKVWTSYAQFARWGICLARTDRRRAEAPGHLLPGGRHDGARHRDPTARADHR